MPLAKVGAALCALLPLGVLLTVSGARAQVDTTGPWFTRVLILFFPNTLECPLDLVQTGTDLVISGTCPVIGTLNASAMIDPMTGAFAGTGTGSAGCPTFTLSAGHASLDGTTFSVQFQCAGSLPVVGVINGFRCGNGVIDSAVGETCDDSNLDDGDCCSSTCHLDPPGQLCFPNDNNQCTDDVCDGTGTCTHPNRTGPCNDSNQCTTGDTCVDGACTTTALPDGSACDDFNDCTDQSCQGGVCAASNKPDGTPCDDFFDCTAGETCLAGSCQEGPPRVCQPCERCYEGDGCVPDDGGYACLSAVESAIQLKHTDPDIVKWKWRSNAALGTADFGDPVTTTSYEVCVFDEYAFDPVTGYPKLLFGAALPAGTEWKASASGFTFKSPDKLKVRFKSGVDGKAKILVRAKGPAHSVEYLPPLAESVAVYLRTTEEVLPRHCFYNTFSPPTASSDTQYRAIYPVQ